MNSKQRRKLIRKHIKSITLLRVKSRLDGQDGLARFSDYYLARDYEWKCKNKNYEIVSMNWQPLKGYLHD